MDLLHLIGYGVDVVQSHEYTLALAIACCSYYELQAIQRGTCDWCYLDFV